MASTTLEIIDLDYLTTVDGGLDVGMKISLIDANRRPLRITIVQLHEHHAVNSLKTGWISSRIRRG